MRLVASSLALLTVLACAGAEPSDVAAAPPTVPAMSTVPAPGGAAAAPAVPAPITIPVFAPAIGDRFAVTSSFGMDLDVTHGAEHAKLHMEEAWAGEATVRNLTDGRVVGVGVRVTSGTHVVVSPKGREEALPDAVGKEYVVTRRDDGEHLVQRADGGAATKDEARGARQIAGKLFPDRTTILTADPGGAVDVELLLGTPEKGETLTGMLTLGMPTPDCAAPFAGVYAGTDASDRAMAASKSMTGTLCMDPRLGLATRTSFSGSAKLAGATASGSGTAQVSTSVEKL
ncbi:MAG: hypothetical protein Q8P41_15855 [Pseudomonadota bacterium]|nr:hypothetical protein [Pseudomonadota bacterium]